MKIINCTPHTVSVHNSDGTKLTLNPSGTVPRVQVNRTFLQKAGGADVYRPDYGKPSGLPDRADDTFYIVSSLLAAAAPDRDDLLTPGNPIRDDQGRVIGCKGLNAPNLAGGGK